LAGDFTTGSAGFTTTVLAAFLTGAGFTGVVFFAGAAAAFLAGAGLALALDFLAGAGGAAGAFFAAGFLVDEEAVTLFAELVFSTTFFAIFPWF